MMSLFQTASGAWHWPSILLFAGWLVTGVFMIANLHVNRGDRLRAFHKEQGNAEVIRETKAKLADAMSAAEAAKMLAARVEEQQTPRTLTEDQKRRVYEYLTTRTKGPISVYHSVGDSEAANFAGQIKALLASCGYQVNGQIVLGTVQTPGLFLVIADWKNQPVYMGNVQIAFESIGFPTAGLDGGQQPVTELRLYIGSKPR